MASPAVATAVHPHLATSAKQAGRAAPPTRLRHLSLGITPLRRHTPPSRPRAPMLFQGSEGLSRPRLTPPKLGGRGTAPPHPRGGVPRSGEGAPVLLEVLGPPCQRPAAALAGLPHACTADICRIIHIFRLRGGSGLRFPQSRLSLSLASLLGWECRVPPPCLQRPRAGPFPCLPRARDLAGDTLLHTRHVF